MQSLRPPSPRPETLVKSISVNMDEGTLWKMQQLADAWGAPEQRYHTLVATRCIERVWTEDIMLNQPRPLRDLAAAKTGRMIGFNLDDETTRQMKDLAELWDLPPVRHATQVIATCVDRVWGETTFLSVFS